LDDDQKFYRKNGYLIKHGLIPAALTEPYLAERSAIQDETFSVWGGSYMDLESMRDVCLFDTLVDLVEKIVGRPVGLFLTLSGFKTTKREWHQDFYLKSGYENIDYCAAWIAVDDVSQDSGPYEFVPESHRLPPLRQELIWEWLEPNQRDTPGATRFAEKFVTAATGRLIKERSLQTKTFVPKRGDVLLWHPFLLHQGTVAKDPDLQRPGLIAHYNSLHTLQIRGRPLLQAPNGKLYVKRTDREAIVKKRLSEKH